MRTIRCTIEMNMIEGEHFNPQEKQISDKEATKRAVWAFVDLLRQAIEGENDWTLDEDSWVEAKIIKDIT